MITNDGGRIVGTSGDDILEGRLYHADVFDANAGGNDVLRGGHGNDVYWLGFGTGHDRIDESQNNYDGGVGDEIRIKAGINEDSVQLSKSGVDLQVRLLGADGTVTDSLTVVNYYVDDYVQFYYARMERVVFTDGSGIVWEKNFLDMAQIIGTSSDDILHGTSSADVFNSNAGGNDDLRGEGGDDVYWLGFGTGHDRIDESHNNNDGSAGDEIHIKADISKDLVHLKRSDDGRDLLVQLLGADGTVTDSLTVVNYYVDGRAQVERVVFTDGGIVEKNNLPKMGRLVGTIDDDILHGTSRADEFDGNAGGNDELRGGGGNDVYWLGFGTGHDRIDESHNNNDGSAGDEIHIKADISKDSVHLKRSDNGRDLEIRLSDGGNSLTVVDYYVDGRARVEHIVFTGGGIVEKNNLPKMGRLVGTIDDDILHGTSRADEFDGDAGGNDDLRGGGGNDVYWLGFGTGHDRINESHNNSDGSAGDEIHIKADISKDWVSLVRSDNGRDLEIRVLGGDDSLTVVDYYVDGRARVERIVFTDGDIVEKNDLPETGMFIGTSGNDVLYGTSGIDVFDAVGGDDDISGGGGDDVYWLGRGTGHDRITEEGGSDKIRIKAGISEGLVRLSRYYQDLEILLLGNDGEVTDSLTVVDYYADSYTRVERVEFTDDNGTVWERDVLDMLPIVGTGEDDYLWNGATSGTDVFDAVGGNDDISGAVGDDVYWLGHGTGHDRIIDFGYADDVDEIRIKAGISEDSIRLVRSDDGRNLQVQLLDNDGEVTDSLTVQGYYVYGNAQVERVVFTDGNGTVWERNVLDMVPIVGTSSDDVLRGTSGTDVFDADVGGNDELHGGGGDDVYWLGFGTGHDRIYEYDGDGDNNEIRIKADINEGSVRLVRSDDGGNLQVQLLDNDGEVTDSLMVVDYYIWGARKVERVVFTDGSDIVWGKNDFPGIEQRFVGTSGDDILGHVEYEYFDVVDVFDANAGGNDDLYGRFGNDVYWLGFDTGHDRIYEVHYEGDNNEIRIKADISEDLVRLVRSDNGEDLEVQLLGTDGMATDSLTVVDYYVHGYARVNRVVFTDGSDIVWEKNDFPEMGRIGAKGSGGISDGTRAVDVFDSFGGGNNLLLGAEGDDVYWLGFGTGHDAISEEHHDSDGSFFKYYGDYDDNEIRIKSDISEGSVRLLRSKGNLQVQLLGADGSVTDSLTVWSYYVKDYTQVERVVFTDGSGVEWGADALEKARLVGGSGDDDIVGKASSDVFDANAGGDDEIYGRGGDDIYWLGLGTGHDRIHEYDGNDGDAADEIRVKVGIGFSLVELLKSGADLQVQLLDGNGTVTDSLTVVNHYSDDSARVERVVLADGSFWDVTDYVNGDARVTEERIVEDDDNGVVHGTSGADIIDAVGDDNHLYGYSGNDVYWLGHGTGADQIDERRDNAGGDAGDEIRIKSDVSLSLVRLVRSDDGGHLYVQLLNESGDSVADSLMVRDYYLHDSAKIERVSFYGGKVWDAADLAAARIIGDAGNNKLYGGKETNDVFDSSGGGNDDLYGYGGDDVYWLGLGTGHDSIHEYEENRDVGDADDEIRIKVGIDESSVRLLRSEDGEDLRIQLLDGDDMVTDSLTVKNYYVNDLAKVERVTFYESRVVWDTADLAKARIVGSSDDDDQLRGEDGFDNIFDSNGGDNDHLYGYGGDDVYWLGYGTGNDRIRESGSDGDAGDEIRIKAGIKASLVRLARDENDKHLRIKLLDGTHKSSGNSLTVEDYYGSESAKVERVVLFDGTVWDAEDLADLRIVGGRGGDDLRGTLGKDVFDSDAGGNDDLYGYEDDDVYWLGHGTGDDRIHETSDGDAGDEIRIKRSIRVSSIRLARGEDDNHLYIQLLNWDNELSGDSLTVEDYYGSESAKVERVVLFDGTVWDAEDLADLRIVGGKGDDRLYGAEGNDVFDSDAGGDDNLYGYGGDDVYWLGRGTGHDKIYEYVGNDGGDADDKIRIKAGINASRVRVIRGLNENNLRIELLDELSRQATNSLTVVNYYNGNVGKVSGVERVFFSEGDVVWDEEILMNPEIMDDTIGDDVVEGKEGNVNDVFDAKTGGNDTLRGYGGDDVYWLGRDTGHDKVWEYYQNDGDDGDEIRIKGDVDKSLVRLAKGNFGSDLRIIVMDGSGEFTDSLTVVDHYNDDDASAAVEQVMFSDGTKWGADDFATAAIIGDDGDDRLYGTESKDIFDSDVGGDDVLYGFSGNDVYRLGHGTGHDEIRENYRNSGDGDDRIRIKRGVDKGLVRLARGNSGFDLRIIVMDAFGQFTDSLTVVNHYGDASAAVERVVFSDTEWDAADFATAAIIGDNGDDNLYGTEEDDIFDSDAGGNDTIHGFNGNDVYLLGRGTGHDEIREHYRNSGDDNDAIRIKAGVEASSVRLRKSNNGKHLRVELLDNAGGVTDSLMVMRYYTAASARVERVELADGTIWDAEDLAELRIIGGESDDDLRGTAGNDVFDSDAGGSDNLYGRSGNDVYWLGNDTDHDRIHEYESNVGTGDGGDEIRIKAGIDVSLVRAIRGFNENNLRIELLDDSRRVTDSLTVVNYYAGNTGEASGVERVFFVEGSIVWDEGVLMGLEIMVDDGIGDDNVRGSSENDVFDARLGGGDTIYGYDGDDVYWLGLDTDHDEIQEYYLNSGDDGDEIRIRDNIDKGSVRLARVNFGEDLRIIVQGGSGQFTDSLTVAKYYTDVSARVERVLFADGTEWDSDDFALARIIGDNGDDNLDGTDGDDIFDSDAGGNDVLRGYSGNDVYWLGLDTDHDEIQEYRSNRGDTGDEIRIKSGIGISSVLLSEEGGDLLISVLGEGDVVTDSLRVDRHFSGDSSAKVESVYADGKVLLEGQYRALMDALALFTAGDTSEYASEEALLNHFWRDDNSLAVNP